MLSLACPVVTGLPLPSFISFTYLAFSKEFKKKAWLREILLIRHSLSELKGNGKCSPTSWKPFLASEALQSFRMRNSGATALWDPLRNLLLSHNSFGNVSYIYLTLQEIWETNICPLSLMRPLKHLWCIHLTQQSAMQKYTS